MRTRGGCPLEPIAERLSRSGDRRRGAAGGDRPRAHRQGAAAQGAAAAHPRRTPRSARSRWRRWPRIGDASAAPAVQKLYEQELKALEALRQDWVTTAAARRSTAPAFDPQRARPEPKAPDSGDASAKQLSSSTACRRSTPSGAREQGRPAGRRRACPPSWSTTWSAEQLSRSPRCCARSGAVKAPGRWSCSRATPGDSSVALRTAALVGLARWGPRAWRPPSAACSSPSGICRRPWRRRSRSRARPGRPRWCDAAAVAGEKLVLLDALHSSARRRPRPRRRCSVVPEGGAEAVLAASMLGRIKAKDAVPTLIKALEDPNERGAAGGAARAGRDWRHQAARGGGAGPVPRSARRSGPRRPRRCAKIGTGRAGRARSTRSRATTTAGSARRRGAALAKIGTVGGGGTLNGAAQAQGQGHRGLRQGHVRQSRRALRGVLQGRPEGFPGPPAHGRRVGEGRQEATAPSPPTSSPPRASPERASCRAPSPPAS